MKHYNGSFQSILKLSMAAAKAEGAKRAKYSELANRHRFEPVAFETTGVMGSSTIEFVSENGK